MRVRRVIGEDGGLAFELLDDAGEPIPVVSGFLRHLATRDYRSVLTPGAPQAGPASNVIRSGELSASSIKWLNSNFLKTELELGHCVRLPQEGPCECDLYLSCAKFVTTPEYAPRLRARRLRELALMEDAISQGWEREVERHKCIASRLEQLLAELGEPIDG